MGTRSGEPSDSPPAEPLRWALGTLERYCVITKRVVYALR